MKTKQRIILFFCFFSLFNFVQAQQVMDTMDPVSIATASADGRLKQGHFQDALASEQKALKLAENRYGITHPSIVPFLNNLGIAYQYLARYADSEAALKWGLAIREKAFGPSDPSVAESIEYLASLYYEMGRWREADFMGNRALSIMEHGVKPEALIQAQNQLGEIRFSLGKPDEALIYFNRSLELLSKNPKIGPNLWINTLNSTASICISDKRFSEAETNLQKALSIAKKNYPADHVEVADSMEKLGDFYQGQNQKDKAQTLRESALPIFQRFVGVNFSYEALPYVKRLSQAYQSLGKNKEAAELLEKSLDSTKTIFGPSHPQTALSLFQLAQVEESLNEKTQAADHLKESMRILTSYFGKDHPLLVKAKSELEKISQN